VGEWVGFNGGESLSAPVAISETVAGAGSALPSDAGCAPNRTRSPEHCGTSTCACVHRLVDRKPAARHPARSTHRVHKHHWRSGGAQLPLGRAGDGAGRVRAVVLRHGRDVGPVLAVLVNVSSSLSSLSSTVTGRGAWVPAFSYTHATAHGGAGISAPQWGVARWLIVQQVVGRGRGGAEARSSQASHAPASRSRVRSVLQQQGLFVVVTHTGAFLSSACHQHTPCPHTACASHAHAQRWRWLALARATPRGGGAVVGTGGCVVRPHAAW